MLLPSFVVPDREYAHCLAGIVQPVPSRWSFNIITAGNAEEGWYRRHMEGIA